MTKQQLASVYRDYIACLNARDWSGLARFVSADVVHNGRRLGFLGYREMLVKDFLDIPDLHFKVDLLVSEPPYVASRLLFNCTPTRTFLDLGVNGRTVSFGENVFYEFRDDPSLDSDRVPVTGVPAPRNLVPDHAPLHRRQCSSAFC